ncbi:MAG: DHH family phosphoesterase, partial [Lachnospiraceae bacterium]|nr:DHH family phosphoesterase [Lachnospiraceae bacterium]
MTEQWFMKKAVGDETLVGKQFGIDPKIARLLLNRGFRTAAAFQEYLRADETCFHDPHSLKDADLCCAFLLSRIRSGKKIRIIGDYDVDGVTSTYIYLKMLSDLGADVDFVIPHRIYDGYGIRMHMIEDAHADGVEVILTCDTGISAYDETVRAKELGLTMLITDHHEVPFEEMNGQKVYKLPPADAIVNPKQEDCTYPQKGICGAVVALKVCMILCEKMHRQLPDELVELAALATVCDVMDLVGENRALVKRGLLMMQNSSNLGLRTLISLTVNRALSAYHLGFVIGPCFNASGRIETAVEAVKLLQAKDPAEAEALAIHLRDLNEERKQMTQANLEAAIQQAEEYEEDKVLVLYLPECHESLAGIVAGRVKEQTNKPTFVLTNAAGEVDASLAVKGSGRSIEAYSMYEKLTEVSDLLTRFGGHPMAAGSSLPYENVDAFRRALNERS